MTLLEFATTLHAAGTISKPLNKRENWAQRSHSRWEGQMRFPPRLLASQVHALREIRHLTQGKVRAQVGPTDWAPLSLPVHSQFKAKLWLLTSGPYALDGLSADWDAWRDRKQRKEVSWDHWLFLSHPVTLHKWLALLWLVIKGLVFYQVENTNSPVFEFPYRPAFFSCLGNSIALYWHFSVCIWKFLSLRRHWSYPNSPLFPLEHPPVP